MVSIILSRNVEKKIIEGRIFLDLTPNSSNWNIKKNETDSADIDILSWTFNG